MNGVSTSRATVRFMVRTRAARGSRASATLSMNVGSCARRLLIAIFLLTALDEKDLGKDCSKLGRSEEDDCSQNYESCSYQSQADLQNQIFAEIYSHALLATYLSRVLGVPDCCLTNGDCHPDNETRPEGQKDRFCNTETTEG